MLHCPFISSVKGVRVPRKRGDGEGSLKQKVIAGGKVWWARWVEYDQGGKKRRPEKIVGRVSEFPSKREAREALNRIIRESVGRVPPMPAAPKLEDVWQRHLTLNKAHWSTAQIQAVEIVMRRAILSQIGDRDIAALTHEPLQAALNRMAEMPLLIGTRKETQHTRIGYGESALKRARTCMRAVFEFAIEEGLVSRNPSRKLILPKTRKPCARFLSIDEVHGLLAVASGREYLTLRLLLVGGLRPAELFALRMDDIRPRAVRIDEAVKNLEHEATGRRVGRRRPTAATGW